MLIQAWVFGFNHREKRRAWVKGEPTGKKKKKKRGSMMIDEAWVEGEPKERKMKSHVRKKEGTCGD